MHMEQWSAQVISALRLSVRARKDGILYCTTQWLLGPGYHTSCLPKTQPTPVQTSMQEH